LVLLVLLQGFGIIGKGKIMDCSCIDIDSSDYPGPKLFKEKIVKARKQHKCSECDADIQPGERYENASGVWDGEFSTHKTCSICCEIRNALFCGTYMFGEVWEEIRQLGDELTLEDLEIFSKEAQVKICEML